MADRTLCRTGRHWLDEPGSTYTENGSQKCVACKRARQHKAYLARKSREEAKAAVEQLTAESEEAMRAKALRPLSLPVPPAGIQSERTFNRRYIGPQEAALYRLQARIRRGRL